MSRIGEGSRADLDLSRAFSGSARDGAYAGHASSSLVSTAALAVFAAAMIVSAPSFGPLVERHVFAGLSDVGDDSSADIAAADLLEPVRLALTDSRAGHIVNTVFDSDGSPLATGSVSRDTPAARQAAEVIADMAETPARMSTVEGLRGSIGPADPQ